VQYNQLYNGLHNLNGPLNIGVDFHRQQGSSTPNNFNAGQTTYRLALLALAISPCHLLWMGLGTLNIFSKSTPLPLNMAAYIAAGAHAGGRICRPRGAHVGGAYSAIAFDPCRYNRHVARLLVLLCVFPALLGNFRNKELWAETL
jgi:hypothetical protein